MDFPGNSLEPSGPARKDAEKPEPEKKVVRKIATGSEAIKKKRTLGSRFREAIGGKDGQSIGDYLMQEVLGPAFRDMITDAVIQGVERLVYGEAQHTSRRSATRRGPVGSSNHISYNRYSTRASETRPPMSNRARATHDFGEIELQTRAQAEAVIAQMDEFIDRFGSTSVADLYEMVDLEAEYTDEKWGWTDLRGADVRRTRNHTYVLILPRTEPIG